MRVGRSCIQGQCRLRVALKRDERELFNAKIDIGKLGVISRPTFRFRERNSTQDFAALHLRGLLLLLCRF